MELLTEPGPEPASRAGGLVSGAVCTGTRVGTTWALPAVSTATSHTCTPITFNLELRVAVLMEAKQHVPCDPKTQKKGEALQQ